MTDGTLGERLYRTVEEYSALGEHHRTGTPLDTVTIDWFVERLERIGGRVERQPYTFDRYDVDWEVRIDGEVVPSIPLFYEGTGSVRTDRPLTAALDIVGGSYIPDLEPLARQALADGVQAAVIAGMSPTGLLMAVNRHPRPGSGLPTVIVPPAYAERLARARVGVEIDAAVVQGASANVFATFGKGAPEERVLLTTPLSGWFRCAGERGGGIALCLEAARVLSREFPVAVQGATGHELMGYGGRRFIEEHMGRPAGIFHFGANIAAGVPNSVTGEMELPARTAIFGWLPEERREAFSAAFRHLDRPVRAFTDGEAHDKESWTGEARAWYAVGVPLLSMAGGGPLHHAPEDVPEHATSPALLEKVCQGVLAAARLLALSRVGVS